MSQPHCQRGTGEYLTLFLMWGGNLIICNERLGNRHNPPRGFYHGPFLIITYRVSIFDCFFLLGMKKQYYTLATHNYKCLFLLLAWSSIHSSETF
jgi:hypothetical protein